MSQEQDKKQALDNMLGNQTLIDEINTLTTSSEDVSWGDYMVVIVLRRDIEIHRARRLSLHPVGTTLVIARKNKDGTTLHSDQSIQNAVRFIKSNRLE